MIAYYRNGCRLGVVFIYLILAGGCANQQANLSTEDVLSESFRDVFEKLPGRVVADSKETFFKTDNITALLWAGGASVAMHNTKADRNLAGNFERHRGFQDITDKTLDFIGGPGAHFGATGLWYMMSLAEADEFNKERAWTMMSALSVTGLATMGLKAIRDNDCPNGKNWAWPSGHTSSSFTVASVLDEFYGPRIGIPAYILASFVGYRMMDTGDHWGSDVVFGAALGWVVGHTVASKHKKLEVAGFKVMPYIATSDTAVMGVSFVKQF